MTLICVHNSIGACLLSLSKAWQRDVSYLTGAKEDLSDVSLRQSVREVFNIDCASINFVGVDILKVKRNPSLD